MELFYIIIPVFAIIFIIILLTIVGVAMRYQDKGTVFPPVANDCPDFWTVASDGTSCAIPAKDKKNVGSMYKPPTDAPNDDSIKLKSSSSANNAFPIYTPGTTDTPSTINFKDETWNAQGLTTVCAKKKWANNWGINWDGITNYNSC
jgi:hypothetical protein